MTEKEAGNDRERLAMMGGWQGRERGWQGQGRRSGVTNHIDEYTSLTLIALTCYTAKVEFPGKADNISGNNQ